MTKIKNNSVIKYFIYRTPFRPVHIGQYLREKYFFRYLQTLPVIQFHKVLDAGCGIGIYTKKLAAVYPHMEVAGLDAKVFASWSESPQNVQFKQPNLIQLSEENCYDFSLCIDVLEHIPGNRLVLEKIYRSLKPGVIFISICRMINIVGGFFRGNSLENLRNGPKVSISESNTHLKK